MAVPEPWPARTLAGISLPPRLPHILCAAAGFLYRTASGPFVNALSGYGAVYRVPLLCVEKMAKYFVPLGLLMALAYGGYAGAWAWRNVATDYPMEYRENAVMFTSSLQSEGQNPYSLELRPVYVNLFGPGYYWATYPLTRWLGNSYQILRTVSLVFVLASCGLLIWGLRIDRCPWWAALSAGALLLGQLGQGLSVTARPDGLALFLLMCSLVIPYRCQFSTYSLAVSATLAILAFLTKPYCVLGLPLVALYVFLFNDKLKGLVFGVAGMVGLLLSLVVMNEVYECYLTDTIFAQNNGIVRSYAHLARVGGQFVRDNLGLFVILVGGLVCWLRVRCARVSVSAAPDTLQAGHPTGFLNRALRGPLLGVTVPFPAVVLACNCAAMVLILGVNMGNDVLYYHQLISPFLLWLAFALASRKGRWQAAWLVVLLANIVWLGAKLPPWPKDHSAEWADADRLIASHQRVFAAPHLSHLLARHGMTVYDAGHTEYARFACRGNPLEVAKEYQQRLWAFLQDIDNQVVNEKFDLVLVCHGYSPFVPWDHLQAHYVCKGPVSAPMTFGYWLDGLPLEMWVPASHAGAADGAKAVTGQVRLAAGHRSADISVRQFLPQGVADRYVRAPMRPPEQLAKAPTGSPEVRQGEAYAPR
jgi:hypothetical protein